MRIEGNSPGWQQVYETWRNRMAPGRPGGPTPSSPSVEDEVAISDAARKLASVPETGPGTEDRSAVRGGDVSAGGAAQSAPAGETREQWIARLREQIASGTYRVDPERLADRILERLTANRNRVTAAGYGADREIGSGSVFAGASGQAFELTTGTSLRIRDGGPAGATPADLGAAQTPGGSANGASGPAPGTPGTDGGGAR